MKSISSSIALGAALLFSGLMQGFALSPSVTSTTPDGGQIGSQMDLVIRGARLEDTREILFYGRGISINKITETNKDSIKVQVQIAPDCPLGEHALRVRTASGVSEVHSFYVGPFPNFEEKEPNSDIKTAQKVPLNTTVGGVIDREDVDYYSIDAKKGQRISIEVEGIRLGKTMFDPAISLQTKDGKMVAQNDDNPLFVQDPVLSVIAPEDGEYVIQVREATYRGNGRMTYRMHVGNFPRPMVVYPAGGMTGENLKVSFIGDASGTFTQDIKLPQAPDDRFPALATRDGVPSSSPNFIRVSSFPNVLEAEPNDDFKQFTSTDITGPVAFNGILQQKGDVDVFRFNAKKGQVFEVNAYGQKVRSPIDTVLNIYDSTGRNLQGNDDSGSSDSYLRFTAPADAAYFVRISDHLGRGGPEYVYRVELTEVQPLLTVSIPQVARNDSQTRQAIAVPRGNRFTTLISVKRDNFRGDLIFQPIDLPAGVTMQADKLPAGQSAFPLVFEAAADAPIAGRIGDLTAKYVEGDQLKSVPGGHKQMIDWVMSNPNQTVYYQSAVTGLTVAVVEEVPFSIDIVAAKVPLTRAGTMDLKVVATRKDGFDEPITVSMVWNPPGVGSVPSIVIPKGQTNGDYRVNANGNADLRSWKIAMLGSAEIKGVRTYVSTKLTDIEIADQFVSGKFEFTKTDQGQPAKVICKLDQKIPFEGKAKVTLQGLPPKVVAPEREITKDMTEVVFDLTTEATSPAGTHRSLFCTIVVPKNNESITHTVASGGILRIDSPRPAKPAESKPAAAKLSAKAEAPANK